jgi:hypothetical protein
MEPEDLQTLFALCPTITNIELKCSNENAPYLKNSNKFKNLNSLKFVGQMNASYFTEFLSTLEENKLKKIQLPDLNFREKKQILKFHKILFEKTNLEEFQFISYENYNEEETKIISNYLEKNSSLKKLDLNCNSIDI